MVAVARWRGLGRRPHKVPRALGIDEKSLAKGHRYATIACDLDKGTVIGIAEGKSGDSLIACLGRFCINDLQAVEAVAMDMSGAYLSRMQAVLDDPDDKIVFDRFHIVAHINDAVDKVRRRENKVLRADGDDRLVGSKHMWLYGAENLPEKYEVGFAALRSADLGGTAGRCARDSSRSRRSPP